MGFSQLGDMAQPEVVGANGSPGSPTLDVAGAIKRKRDSMDIDEEKPVANDAWAGRNEKELIGNYYEALRRYVCLSAESGFVQLVSPVSTHPFCKANSFSLSICLATVSTSRRHFSSAPCPRQRPKANHRRSDRNLPSPQLPLPSPTRWPLQRTSTCIASYPMLIRLSVLH